MPGYRAPFPGSTAAPASVNRERDRERDRARARARHRGRAGRRRAIRRFGGTPFWSVLWDLIKETTNTCMEYRVTGLAAEVAFFTLMSVPPLLLCVAGTLGYLDDLLGAGTIADLQRDILNASGTVLSQSSIDQIVKPLLRSVFDGGQPGLISIGFAFALWSGSRALYVFVDTVTIMYGLDGKRGIVHTRVLSLGLYIAALIVGSVVLPLIVAGPGMVVAVFPATAGLVHALYWPAALLLSVVFLTTLYHVAVPVRTPWREDIPGALVALLVLVVGSIILRVYLVHSVEGPTVYGSLAAPVAVLLWIGVTAMSVLVGAAMNAAVDRKWPSAQTLKARAEIARARRRADAPVDPEGNAPAEFPERWANFLPPTELRARLRAKPTLPEDEEQPQQPPGDTPQ
ncbi:YihY/virulence factor BrkB family protein [Phaeacidiphilus oryzae]|uniref:YihY/virulence factor BrkB family protein n=1 Tax=Phaeacidiphilus oryzae TaxID=348818 RepID=UPI00389AAD82